jgi:signal peptidase II
VKRFFTIFVVIFAIDQLLKAFFLTGFVWHTPCISLILALNKGVAFSLFAFLDDALKYLQLALIAGLAWWSVKEGYIARYEVATALIGASALSNVLDRFTQGGVVDYVYWHCGFDFAIFNFADVCIDIGVILLIWGEYKKSKTTSTSALS